MLDYVLNCAIAMPYVQGQRRIYSVITDKRGRILSEGSNSYCKSHPIQAHYAERVELNEKIFLHAEISALVKLRQGEPYKIYIARVNSENQAVLAAPCKICQLAIKEAGIEVVEHTI